MSTHTRDQRHPCVEQKPAKDISQQHLKDISRYPEHISTQKSSDAILDLTSGASASLLKGNIPHPGLHQTSTTSNSTVSIE